MVLNLLGIEDHLQISSLGRKSPLKIIDVKNDFFYIFYCFNKKMHFLMFLFFGTFLFSSG